MKFFHIRSEDCYKIRYDIQMHFKYYKVLQMYSIQQEHAWFNYMT